QPDLSSNPLASPMGRTRCVPAGAAAAEFWAECGTLNLAERLQRSPGLVPARSGHINLQPNDRRNLLLCGEQVVQHHIDHHARDRDVEPNRKRPACDGAMSVKTSAQPAT